MTEEETGTANAREVPREFIIIRDGKEFCLYEGLLALAHEDGLSRIATTIVQIPHEDNGHFAVMHAEVETRRGTFQGVGDASPESCNRMIVPHLLRMSETRAKARALRDAVNIGITSTAELGGDGDDDGLERSQHSYRDQGRPEGGGQTYRASPYKAASANQLATIAKLSRLVGVPEEPDESMTSAAASDRIQELSKEYNRRKGQGEAGRRS